MIRRNMKTILTGGITAIEPVPSGTAEWYFGRSGNPGDLYEAQEQYQQGHLEGNSFCLIHYPDGTVYRPYIPKNAECMDTPVYFDGMIYFLIVNFAEQAIRIFRFDCHSHETAIHMELPLDAVKNCYNLKLHIRPLCLTRQGDDNRFEVIWPERISFAMDAHESFFLRDGEKLYFSRWQEEGDGADYRYWEETVVRNLSGEQTEVLPGDIRMMPNGELWHLK